MKFRFCAVFVIIVLGVISASCVSARDFIVRNATTSAAYFKVDGTLGYVGIATTTPSYKLDVVGTSQFSQPVIVGTPTAATHATTKSYVDSMFTGSGQWTTNGGLVYLTSTTQNVGIGTTAPKSKLHVGGTTSDEFSLGTTNYGGNSGQALATIQAGQDDSAVTYGGLMYFKTLEWGGGTSYSPVTRMTINKGNVGIGTTAPGGKLQVVTGSTAGLIIDTSMPTTPHLRIDSANNLVVDAGSSGSQKLYLNYDSNRDIVTGSGNLIVNGNVGIGTTGPGYKLEVTGTGSFSQPVIVGTPTATTHATTKSYVDSMFTGSGQWTTNGGLVYLTSTTQNVGIGTTAIGGKLSIFNNASDLILKLGDNRTAVSGDFISKIAFYDYADTESAYVGLRHNQYNGASPRALAFGVSGNEYMRINNSGNVGIGTTGPNSKLSVMIAGTSGIPALGTNSNGFSIVRSADGVVGMHFGYDTASGNGYIQQQRTDSATAYNLLLQPNGGNVGIATTTPSYKLDVVGGGQFSQPIVIGTPTIAGHAATKSYVDSSVTGAATQWTTTSTGVFYNSGNVGIGTTGPVTKLEIQGTTPSLRVTGASGTVPSLELSSTGIVNWKLQSNWDSASGFAVLQDATERLVIKSGGNVGIGTTNPVAKLEVVGDIQTSNQGRFKGWYTAGSGLAAELGISSGEGFYLAYNRTTSAYSPVNMQAGGTALRLPVDGMATLTNGLSVTTGNVGIATSTPNYSLTVNGYGWFNQPVIVGTPVATNHAATKSYVDSIIGGSTSSTSNYVLKTGDAMSGNLNMNGSNITAVNKLTVTTIDPLYEIGGVKYSTYASAIVGGVKEEFVGRGRLEKISKDKLQMILDFSKVEKGSDLWVWYNAIDFSKDNVEVLATAYNIPIPIAYTIKNNSIIFNAISNEGIEFSYRLVGKRFDWRKWPTYAKDQNEPAGLIIK